MKNTDSSGGTRFSEGKPAGWWYAPIYGLRLVAKVWEMGAEKYAPMDWAVGQNFSTLIDCAMRHTLEIVQRGPWAKDEESGQYHAAHVAWNWLTLLTFMALERHDLDDITKWQGVTAADREAVNRPQEGDHDFIGPVRPKEIIGAVEGQDVGAGWIRLPGSYRLYHPETGRECCGDARLEGAAGQCADCDMHSIELRVVRDMFDHAP